MNGRAASKVRVHTKLALMHAKTALSKKCLNEASERALQDTLEIIKAWILNKDNLTMAEIGQRRRSNMDNEAELEMPPPKKIRLEESKREISDDTPPAINGIDSQCNWPSSHVEVPRVFSDNVDPSSETASPSAILQPTDLPGHSFADNDPMILDSNPEHNGVNRVLVASGATSARSEEESTHGIIHIEDTCVPEERRESPGGETTSISTAEPLISAQYPIEGNHATASGMTDDGLPLAREAEPPMLANIGEPRPQDSLHVVTNISPNNSIRGATSEGQQWEDPNRSKDNGIEKEVPKNEHVARNIEETNGMTLVPLETRDINLESVQSAPLASEGLVEPSTPSAEAEFELDSSPYESSSSDSSSDTSSSESDVDDYEMLSPEEEARRLMAEDGGAEEKATSGAPRTLNEKPDEVVPKPDVTITADMKLEELGCVENLVENLALIKANTSGEYQVLEAGSVLCLEDRSVIGAVAETLGRVQQPYYSVCFTNPAAMSEAGIVKDVKVFYVPQFSTTVFTQPLKGLKGSDASNMHDEEVGDEELDFSDDEAEAEHKRQAKLQKRARFDSKRGRGDGFSRGPQRTSGNISHQLHGHLKSSPPRPSNPGETTLNYDDAAEDGDELYTPLSRPSNLHEMMDRRDAPIRNAANHGSTQRGGRGRGRGDRGEGRGGHHRNRGTGPAGKNDRRDQRNPPNNNYSHAQGSSGQRSFQRHQNNASATSVSNLPPRPPHHNDSFNSFPQPQYSPTEPQLHSAHSSSQPYLHPAYSSQYPSSYDQSYHQQYQQPQHTPNQYFLGNQHQGHFSQQSYSPAPQYQAQQPPPASPSSATIPPGAHINPNFFRQQVQHSPQSWQQQAQTHYPPQQYQQYQQYQHPSSAGNNAGPLSPEAARRLQESLAKLNNPNGSSGAPS